MGPGSESTVPQNCSLIKPGEYGSESRCWPVPKALKEFTDAHWTAEKNCVTTVRFSICACNPLNKRICREGHSSRWFGSHKSREHRLICNVEARMRCRRNARRNTKMPSYGLLKSRNLRLKFQQYGRTINHANTCVDSSAKENGEPHQKNHE